MSNEKIRLFEKDHSVRVTALDFFYYLFSALEFNVHELTINGNTILHDLFFYSISVMCVIVYQREYPIFNSATCTVLHIKHAVCCQ